MKKIALGALAITALLAFSSCEKCRTCEYSVTVNGNQTATVTAESCGKKDDLDSFEADTRTAAEASQAATGGTLNFSCTDD